MGQSALRYSEDNGSPVRQGAAVDACALPRLCLIQGGFTASRKNEVLVLGVILALLQVLDGLLTGLGMASFGTSMEGNLLLRSLMHAIGWAPAIILVKGASIGIIVFLCGQAGKVSWLKQAMRGVAGLYVVFAIVPWTYILAMQFLA